MSLERVLNGWALFLPEIRSHCSPRYVLEMARGDLQNPKLIYLKGASFVAIALASISLLLLENFSFRFAALLGISLWACCRSYYFAFYVIEHYVDPNYQFAGLLDFARYLVGQPRR